MKKMIAFETTVNDQKVLALRSFPENDPLQQSENTLFIDDVENHPFPDNYFFGAWELDAVTKEIVINKEKAIEMYIKSLCVIRDKKLKELDAETIKAIQQKDDILIGEIAAKAQELRDMPATAQVDLENMVDFDVIKNYTPECLK